MDECLQVLSSVNESPTDEMFTHQIRLQLIVEKVIQSSSIDTLPDQSRSQNAHLPFYLMAFRSQLADIKRSLSSEAQINREMLLHQ